MAARNATSSETSALGRGLTGSWPCSPAASTVEAAWQSRG
jgi:hypothetical protein